MKKMLLVALMVLVGGTAAYASLLNQPTGTASTPANAAAPVVKKVECIVKGKAKWVKSVDACKALGGMVVEAKKVA